MTLQRNLIERAHMVLGIGAAALMMLGLAFILGGIAFPTRMEAEMGMSTETALVLGGGLLLGCVLCHIGARRCVALSSRMNAK